MEGNVWYMQSQLHK